MSSTLYCSPDDVSSRLKLQNTGDYDGIVDDAIEEACRAIDAHCGQFFYSAASSAKVFDPFDSTTLYLPPVQSVTTLKTDEDDDGTYETTWASTDFQTYPLNGWSGGITGHPVFLINAIGDYTFPTTNGVPSVQVTGAWGWAAVPAPVKSAAITLASAIVFKSSSPAGVVGQDAFGTIRLPRDEKQMVEGKLAPFCRLGGSGLFGFA